MPNRTAIRQAIFAGIRAANVKYENWSNGRWLTDCGAESLMVSAIAERLSFSQNGHESLVMAAPFHEIGDWSCANRPRGRPSKTVSGSRRTDIVLLNRHRRPVCAIEVERVWNRDRCFADLTGIRDLVIHCDGRNDGSLRRGFLAVMLARKATARKAAKLRVEEQAARIERAIRSGFDSKGLAVRCYAGGVRDYPKKYRQVHGECDWAHAGFCVEVSAGYADTG